MVFYFILVLLVSFLFNTLAYKIANKSEYPIVHTKGLWDISHFLFSEDIRIVFTPFLHNIFTILPFLLLLYHSEYNIFDTFLTKFSILLILRCVLNLCTILPRIRKDTEFKIYGGGNDMLLSGHISFLTLTILYLIKINGNEYYKYISGLYLFIMMIMTSAIRNHYTVDVIIAFILSYLIFYYE
jgi:hypothetical protein